MLDLKFIPVEVHADRWVIIAIDDKEVSRVLMNDVPKYVAINLCKILEFYMSNATGLVPLQNWIDSFDRDSIVKSTD